MPCSDQRSTRPRRRRRSMSSVTGPAPPSARARRARVAPSTQPAAPSRSASASTASTRAVRTAPEDRRAVVRQPWSPRHRTHRGRGPARPASAAAAVQARGAAPPTAARRGPPSDRPSPGRRASPSPCPCRPCRARTCPCRPCRAAPVPGPAERGCRSFDGIAPGSSRVRELARSPVQHCCHLAGGHRLGADPGSRQALPGHLHAGRELGSRLAAAQQEVGIGR